MRFFLNIAPVWQNFKIKHPFETSCVHSCVEKKGKLVWWSKTISSLFNYSIYFLVHHFKTSLIINSKLLIREQKSCTIWNICEEDSFIKIFFFFSTKRFENEHQNDTTYMVYSLRIVLKQNVPSILHGQERSHDLKI